MRRTLILPLLFVFLSHPLNAAAPWADPGLEVTEGLELWLDAGAQDSARTAHWLGSLRHRSPVGVWYDGSGRNRHAQQHGHDARPKFLRYGVATAARFDGKDDYLTLAGPIGSHKNVTVFLLAAPRSNAGGFRGMFAAAQLQRNDYTTGLNIDQGAYPTQSFEFLNVEGAGFVGVTDLTQDGGPFGQYHVVTVTATPNKGVVAMIDGRFGGKRDRKEASIFLEAVAIGARLYAGNDDSPFAQGFFDGDIAEVLVYSRALDNAERQKVEHYLLNKRQVLDRAAAESEAGFLIEPVKDAPPVQVLLPGFSVKQLPLDLTNINNVRYREDGKLVALAYNGNVWLLSDTNSDGVEDKADLFWKNDGSVAAAIGIALTPPGYTHGRGAFFASKTGIVLVTDTDGDDKADKKTIVAEGWEPSGHGVDALGVAVGPDGSVYFGLGTSSFPAPYMIDKEGKAKYDVKGERGTIMRVAPDFSKRQIVATGIRFPVGIALNREGDVFCTDQEGATWVPNGNPLDELLHIQPGRHYGFPARHPKHLPSVIDEPSVFDYGPQHQSTCGIVFNDPVHGGPVFGPAWWWGDAIVTGESRGKIYRTKLVKTEAGYVASNQIVACLGMLTIDACVSPDGDLVVACHSGPPDWGTGPEGKGKLYKVFYTDKQHPQPVAAWASGPTEVRIAFDRPLLNEQLANLTKGTSISYGYGVRAGDRFETLWPGYAVLERQRATTRFNLPVLSASVTPDRRTLVLTTGLHPQTADYAVKLPGMSRPQEPSTGELPQHAAIDLDYTLNGVEAVWADEAGQVRWSGWLPHADSSVAKAFTAGSAEHETLWALMDQPGTLTIRTRLDLKDMLRPAVQPGSQIDFTWPTETVTLAVRGTGTVKVSVEGPEEVAPKGDDTVTVQVPKTDQPLEVEIALTTGTKQPSLGLTFSTHEDDRPRALPLRRLFVPWSPTGDEKPQLAARKLPQLEGGDWARGREVFFSEQAVCSKCHSVRGRGGHIGPDLTNLVHRDYASVLRDIEQPGATLNPDHIAYMFALSDGRKLVGVPRSLPDGKTIIGDAAGIETVVTKDEITAMTALPASLMPPGLNLALGPEKFRDLMTYLMTEPLEPAELKTKDAPPARKRAEVQAVLDAGDKFVSGELEPMHVLLVAGPKDHGPDEHDYPLWKERWSKLLPMAEEVTVDTAENFPSDEQLAKADVAVFFQFGDWNEDRAKAIDAFLGRGGGLVYLHWAVAGRERAGGFAERIGLAAGLIKFRHGGLDLKFTDHPITRGFRNVHFHDESYWKMTGDPGSIHVLATGVEEGEPQPLMWTREKGKGRIFVSIPGHFTWTFDDPLFRVLVLRGIAWTGREPTERLTGLATIGARLAD